MVNWLSFPIYCLVGAEGTALKSILRTKLMKKRLISAWTYCCICDFVPTIEHHASSTLQKDSLLLILRIIPKNSASEAFLSQICKDINISFQSAIGCKHGIEYILALMKRHPIIGKHWIWSVICPWILRNDDTHSFVLEFADEWVELRFGCIVDELCFGWLALWLVEVVGDGHRIAFESEGTDHYDCVRQGYVLVILHATNLINV